MFNAANETHFSLTLEGVDHNFQVLEFRGREAISQPYRFDLELVSERADLDLQALLHRPAFLTFDPAGMGIHGLVHHIAQGESGQRLTRYRLTLVPQLAYLAHRTNQRIFQHLKATTPPVKAMPPPDAEMADPQADKQPPAKPFDQIEEW